MAPDKDPAVCNRNRSLKCRGVHHHLLPNKVGGFGWFRLSERENKRTTAHIALDVVEHKEFVPHVKVQSRSLKLDS